MRKGGRKYHSSGPLAFDGSDYDVMKFDGGQLLWSQHGAPLAVPQAVQVAVLNFQVSMLGSLQP